MRDADDTVTGGPVVAVHECPCGTPVVVPLAGGARCHSCGRLHAMGERERDDVSEEVALSELPGVAYKRITGGGE